MAAPSTAITVGSVPWSQDVSTAGWDTFAGNGGTQATAFLSYVPANSGTMTVDTFGSAAGVDTFLQIWNADCTVKLAENDNATVAAATYPGDPGQYGSGKVWYGATTTAGPSAYSPALGARRLFFRSTHTPTQVAAAVQAEVNGGRLALVSVRPSSGYVGADATAESSYFEELCGALGGVTFPAGHPLEGEPAPSWVCAWHEPENDPGASPSAFAASSQRLADAITTVGVTNVTQVDILMAYTFLDASGRDYAAWRLACKGTLLGLDHYAHRKTGGGYEGLTDSRLATIMARSGSKPLVWPEFAVTQWLADADLAAWRQQILDFVAAIESDGRTVGAFYFDSDTASSDYSGRSWYLTSAQRSWFSTNVLGRTRAAHLSSAPAVLADTLASAVGLSVTGGTTYIIALSGVSSDIVARVNVYGPLPSAPGTPPDSFPGGIGQVLPTLSAANGVAVQRVSDVWPDPTFDATGRIVPLNAPTSTTVAALGTLHLVVDGVDVTSFRGGFCLPQTWSMSEPFGEETCAFDVSHLQPIEVPGAGDVAWLHDGAPVDIVLRTPGGEVSTLWCGLIVSIDPDTSETDWTYQVQCKGALHYADTIVNKPPTYLEVTDLGTLIPRQLNAVISHPYTDLAAVATGINTVQRGSSDNSVLEDAQERLSTMTTEDGSNQWTIGRTASPRQYQMRLKDVTTEHWTISAIAPGVSVSLARDYDAVTNVIYGRGVTPAGYGWANYYYPNKDLNSYVAYPLTIGNLVTVGTADDDTLTGHGISDMQRKLQMLGYRITVDGVYNSTDASIVRTFQSRSGILVDGVVGPQTWNTIFPQYSASNLDAFRLPIAWDPVVEPRLYAADGTDLGANPDYDPSQPRREVDIDYGAGVTKTDATRDAKARLARDGRVGWVGSITLNADPENGSIFDIREGQNIRLRHYADEPLLHIARVTIDSTSLTATLDVDERSRDLLTMLAIRDRDKAALIRPQRLPANKKQRRSSQQASLTAFDGESPGGFIRPMPLIPGLWCIQRIPVSEAGLVARIELRTTPAAKFSVAFFGDLSVTANFLAAKVGDPLATVSDGFGPYDRHKDDLMDMGYIQAIGGPGQAAGYSHGYETSPYDGSTTTLTGRLYADGQWSYQSTKPPFLLVAFWVDRYCTVTGRLLPQPVE